MLPLADATALTFLAPLIAALLSPFVLKERLSLATVFVIPLCIVGVTFITKPSFFFNGGGRGLPLAGVVIGLLQPFFSATAKVHFVHSSQFPLSVLLMYVRA
jgi:drug/metabolite transporter (DMT)-like permease